MKDRFAFKLLEFSNFMQHIQLWISLSFNPETLKTKFPMNCRSFSKFSLLFMLLVAVLVTSCEEETAVVSDAQLVKSYDATVALKWNELFLEIDRYSPGYRPPAAARLLAYTGLAAYEAGVPGMPEYNSMRYEFPAINLPVADLSQEYHWPASINACYASMFRRFYPHISEADKAKISALENQFNADFSLEASPEVIARSKEFGTAVAIAVYDYSTTDTPGHEAYLNPRPASYIPPATGPMVKNSGNLPSRITPPHSSLTGVVYALLPCLPMTL